MQVTLYAKFRRKEGDVYIYDILLIDVKNLRECTGGTVFYNIKSKSSILNLVRGNENTDEIYEYVAKDAKKMEKLFNS